MSLEPTEAGGLAVDTTFARGRDLLRVTVTGDCLAPDLRHGDVVVVDQARKDLAPGQLVVALINDGELLVKRYDVRPSGAVLLDNEGHEYYPDGARIEGLVVASWRRH